MTKCGAGRRCPLSCPCCSPGDCCARAVDAGHHTCSRLVRRLLGSYNTTRKPHGLRRIHEASGSHAMCRTADSSADCGSVGQPRVRRRPAPAASAWAWDPHVRVWFNVSNCAGASGQWGWYQASGESGWVSWNAGYQGYFDLWRVSTSGSVTSIKWGTPGRTCGVRYFNITRPSYGTTAALGWIG